MNKTEVTQIYKEDSEKNIQQNKNLFIYTMYIFFFIFTKAVFKNNLACV